jgi:UDP:flavonoid glycosyltransferase YjiC (YdhE family)
MKILLISIGTRGDIEPFLSIGKLLKDKKQQVICAFPEQFRARADEAGLAFASLGTKFIELLNSPDGRAAMGGSSSGLKRFWATIRLAKHQTEINKELVFKQFELVKKEKPDRVVYNGKAVYPILWELNHRGRTTFISPVPHVHYAKGHSHVVFNRNLGTFLNKLSFWLVHFGMITTVMITKKWLKIPEKVSRKELRHILKFNQSIYTISPALIPRPKDWKDSIKVLGYHEAKNKGTWKPGKALNDFLEKHPKILFITFGSMLNPMPEAKTILFLDILERNKIPAIINIASGGLVQPDGYDSELIHFSTHIPYNQIFSKMYAVIHHGGSGTTHLALKYGCASMIIPHIIDQFVWNKIIYRRRFGPKGIKISKLTTENLESGILDLMSNINYKKNAEQIGIQMAKETFEEEIYHTIVG